MNLQSTAPPDFCIAAVQLSCQPGDIEANLQRHVQWCESAAKQGAQLVVFPELSLTGYEISLASSLAMTTADPRLSELKKLAVRHQMTIVAGAALRSETGQLYIAAWSFHPDGSLTVYTKQHLHEGEQAVFFAGHGGALLDIGTQQVALAVCADISQASHAQHAANQGASLYAASVLISENGYTFDTGLLAHYAKTHQMSVLMANFAGQTGGWTSAGKSALWDSAGRLVGAAANNFECMLVGQLHQGQWTARLM